MKKIILGAILLFSVMSCTKEEDINEIPVQSNIEKITDGSVKEGYVGTVMGANKIAFYNDELKLEPVKMTNYSLIYLVYMDDNIFLTFSDWGSPESGAPFYTQGDYVVYKVEKGKVYFWYEHKVLDNWIKCEHVLDISNGVGEAYLGGLFGSKKRYGNHSHGVMNSTDYFIDFYKQ